MHELESIPAKPRRNKRIIEAVPELESRQE
jgi:hypothetical protein